MKVLVEFDSYYLERDYLDLNSSLEDAKDLIKDMRDILDASLIKRLKDFVGSVEDIKEYLLLLKDAEELEE